MSKLTIISGSHNVPSNSFKVGQYLANNAVEKGFSDIEILDLAKLDIPFWNMGVWQQSPQWDFWQQYATILQQSDAFIVITPEWNGMVTPILKNFFLLCNSEELGHKPALPVAVAAKTGGAAPIAELRISSYKNSHICWLPEHLIFRFIEDFFAENREMEVMHKDLENRTQHCLTLLKDYSDALKHVREKPHFNYDDFRHGM